MSELSEQDIVQMEQQAHGIRDSIKRLIYERDHRPDMNEDLALKSNRLIDHLMDMIESIDQVTYAWRAKRKERDE